MGAQAGERLAAFLPADVRAGIIGGCPRPDRGHGSVLEADVSSFTLLTDELARRHGPSRGAEEVARLLTRLYGAVVAEVDRFAGSVVEFTGDSVACCFDDDDDGMRAVQCGLAMQQAVAALRSTAGADPALKVTVAVGDYRRFSVGDPAVRLLEVLAGPAVDRLSVAASVAEAGEVVIDAATARGLGARLELIGRHAGAGVGDDDTAAVVAAVRDPPPRPPAPPPAPHAITAEQARPWLPAAIHERIAGGHEHLLGELRSVVALFVRFGGIDYDDDDAGARLDAYARFAQHTLDGYGGSLFSIAVDAKGSYLCAGFGAPVAHDDDPLRAAAAALVLGSWATAAPGGVTTAGIGLARGRLYAGPFGGETRRTFGLQGSTMNLAARLMQSAGADEILVEESLARLLEDRNELRPRPARHVKGRPDPVAVRALVGPRAPDARAPAPPHLVNRLQERAALEASLRRLAAGTGGVLVLEGEPGIGKTRLVRHLTDQAAAAGVVVHQGAGDPIERGAPYHGWRAIFTGALGLDRLPADPAARRALTRERIAALAPAAAPAITSAPALASDADGLFAAVLPAEMTDALASTGLSGEARGEATRELLAQTLGTLAATAPTLVVLEDAHWLDSASLALALRLAVAPGPLLLAITTRPVAESANPAELERFLAMPGTELLRIRPLAPAESIELAVRAIGGEPTARLAATIEAKAGGNPLFSRELAYAMRDAGLLDARLDLLAAASPSPDASPDRVETVIASRVDRLPTAAQALLKVGSVLGAAFAEEAALALAGPDALAQRARLEQLELLAPAEAAAPGTIAFRHALIRDVVHSHLLYAQRRDLHAAAAEYYERTAAVGSTPAALAHHWEQAEVPARAVEHLVRAGEAALHAGAFRECLAAYERALALSSEPDPRRAEWTWHAAHACYRLGYIDRSRELGARAIAALDRPVPPGSAPAVAAAALGELARQAGHRLLPRVLPRPAPQPARDEIVFAAEALTMMAEVYYVAADKARSSYVALRGLNLVESIPPCAELARSYGSMSIISGLVGVHRLAERYAALAQQTAAQLGDPECAAHTLQQISMYRSSVGPYDAFGELYENAIAGYRRLGNRPRLRDTAGMAAIADHLFGRPELADERMHELLGAVEPHEVTLGASWAHLWLGIGALRRGDPAEALRRIAIANGLRDPAAVDVVSVNVHAISALALRRSGRPAEAAVEEAAARALVRKLGRRPAAHIVLDGYAALAELALAAWDDAGSARSRLAARRHAREASRNLRTFARTFAIGAPVRWLYEGERDRRRGRHDRAIRAWQRARDAATRLDMRHELALADAALGDHLPPGPEADRHKGDAARLLEQLGEPPAARAVLSGRRQA